MSLLVIYFPFLGFIISGLLGRFLGSKGSGFITVFCMLLTNLVTGFLFYEIGLANSFCHYKIMPWINCEYLLVYWGFLFDSLTVTMLVVVNFVSLLVHVFSLNYMKEDPHFSRFMSYLSLFTFFMIILVTADNFVQMFVGWEGVGLVSYLLINFWFTRYQANKSSLKAVILNRFGDFGLVLGLAIIFKLFKSFDYLTIFSLVADLSDITINFIFFDINAVNLCVLFLFIGAVGKSAQMGLHIWLPDAMEGPTPVSALIHAATMVTAGVFILIRSSPLLEYGGFSLEVITICGGLTAFFAATTGLVQNDLKKVIAYSTCSQLGYMVFSCGLSNYAGSLFHLMNHAFFKALLFLSAGAVIHALNDEQDMRKMGGLYKILPFIYQMFLIGSLSLMGFPWLTGFYSKDLILELSFANYNILGSFSYMLGTFSAFFTAFYSFRLIYFTFFGRANGYRRVYAHIHEVDIFMGIPLILLGFGSIFVGYLFKDLLVGVGTLFWNNVLFLKSDSVSILLAEFIPFYVKILPVSLSLSGAVLSIYLYKYNHKVLSILYKFSILHLYTFLNKKWYFDLLYYYFIIKPSLCFGYHISFKLIDRGIIEILGPLGIIRCLNRLSKGINMLNTGYLYNYGFFFICGLTGILSILLLRLDIFNIVITSEMVILNIILVLFYFFKLIFKYRD